MTAKKGAKSKTRSKTWKEKYKNGYIHPSKGKVLGRGRDRIDHFRKFGFNTLIIWDFELQNENLLVNKIENFCASEVF
jgi:G:T-mismatch repair DNA endonuclease (very short patch repair protein)